MTPNPKGVAQFMASGILGGDRPLVIIQQNGHAVAENVSVVDVKFVAGFGIAAQGIANFAGFWVDLPLGWRGLALNHDIGGIRCLCN